MGAFETLAIKLGPSLAKALAKLWLKDNAVHFTSRTAAVRSMRVVGCGTRERSG